MSGGRSGVGLTLPFRLLIYIVYCVAAVAQVVESGLAGNLKVVGSIPKQSIEVSLTKHLTLIDVESRQKRPKAMKR